jgi:hypothetical protein
MDKNIESILASVNFIKDRMLTKDEGATKDDLSSLSAISTAPGSILI